MQQGRGYFICSSLRSILILFSHHSKGRRRLETIDCFKHFLVSPVYEMVCGEELIIAIWSMSFVRWYCCVQASLEFTFSPASCLEQSGCVQTDCSFVAILYLLVESHKCLCSDWSKVRVRGLINQILHRRCIDQIIESLL